MTDRIEEAAKEVDAHDLMSLTDLVNEACALNGSMALWGLGHSDTGESWDTLSAKYLKVRAVIKRRFGADLSAEIQRLRGERDEFKRRLEEYEPLPECPECGRTDDHLHHFD